MTFRFHACLLLFSLVISTGIFALFLAYLGSSSRGINPYGRAYAELRELDMAISGILADNPNATRQDLDRELSSGKYFAGELRDPWHTDYRLNYENDVSTPRFVITSAGENGTFGDMDDINTLTYHTPYYSNRLRRHQQFMTYAVMIVVPPVVYLFLRLAFQKQPLN